MLAALWIALMQLHTAVAAALDYTVLAASHGEQSMSQAKFMYAPARNREHDADALGRQRLEPDHPGHLDAVQVALDLNTATARRRIESKQTDQNLPAK